ncbi:hypothetical protein K9L05_00690 [Candidatus Babeliales bacterium]|nr:hypothetical protein [Candidatus Babeliales bacterium]MCF7899151.1 hypothetical protein [Candidatus Babeliales bacterium]
MSYLKNIIFILFSVFFNLSNINNIQAMEDREYSEREYSVREYSVANHDTESSIHDTSEIDQVGISLNLRIENFILDLTRLNSSDDIFEEKIEASMFNFINSEDVRDKALTNLLDLILTKSNNPNTIKDRILEVCNTCTEYENTPFISDRIELVKNLLFREDIIKKQQDMMDNWLAAPMILKETPYDSENQPELILMLIDAIKSRDFERVRGILVSISAIMHACIKPEKLLNLFEHYTNFAGPFTDGYKYFDANIHRILENALHPENCKISRIYSANTLRAIKERFGAIYSHTENKEILNIIQQINILIANAIPEIQKTQVNEIIVLFYSSYEDQYANILEEFEKRFIYQL